MFTRSVNIDGTLYRNHEVYGIEHIVKNQAGTTNALVKSTAGAEERSTRHALAFDVGMTFEEAEQAVMELPFFAEVVDPLSGVVAELEEQAEQQAALIDEMGGMLDDDEAITVPQAFHEWQPDTAYSAGDRRRYADGLYKCLAAHTSVEGQTPDVAVSLWAPILAGQGGSEVGEWVQPDSTNPYMKGDRVTYNGKLWESDYDYNVYVPGIAGWHEVEEA